ncbi:MAG TPA: penicillin-binding protein 2 [Chromatiales bacterium]|nr:penicillin-binding protein 2 [Chromatiales bacterium]
MARSRRKTSRRRSRVQIPQPRYTLRRWVVSGVLLLALLLIVGRAVERQVLERDFLQAEGERRYLRTVEMPALRGVIFDRHGEPLALTTPVESIWVNPQALPADAHGPLAKGLGVSVKRLRKVLSEHQDKHFVYLKRRAKPDLVKRVRKAIRQHPKKLRGVHFEREYQRFYPAGEVAAHVLGFTNIDDHGQEGLELAYDDWLTGTAGAKRVLKDGSGRVVRDVENIRGPEPGKDLVTSIDRRLQFLAYRELKAAVKKHRALAGSAVILDARSGEVLAMVNQPSYNPNGRRDSRGGRFRNRAVTDMFEPGSAVKPLIVAAALEAGLARPTTRIDTTPGLLRVGRHTVRDARDYGVLDVNEVIQKSSNVGISKIALQLAPEVMWRLLTKVGFGEETRSGFPGEAFGRLPHYERWSTFGQATLAFGYGLSVTTMQLAKAYAAIAADGVKRSVSLLKREEIPGGERVLRRSVARDVRRMMEGVVSTEGTAPQAAIPRYRVAGKTGTAKKVTAQGYAKDKYLAIFAGMVPASAPRLVMVVMIDEPRAGQFYGGQVAAPVFARVMSGALRLLNISPDGIPQDGPRLASSGERL